MKIIEYSQEPKFYWSALPPLLAAAAGLTWEQFINNQTRDKSRLFETLFRRAGMKDGEGARVFAAVLAHMMLEMNAYMEVQVDVAMVNSKAILEEAAMILDEIRDQALATPVEGPKLTVVDGAPDEMA